MKAERKELNDREIKKQELPRPIGANMLADMDAVHLNRHKKNKWVRILIPLDSQGMI